MIGQEELERALSYPYETPPASYLFRPGRGAGPIPDSLDDALRGRTAVLAVGSNSAPEQLERKLADLEPSESVPVLETYVRDHDVVYASRIAPYGAIPATLHPSPGTTVRVFTTFLTPAQLECINDSESLGEAYAIERYAATVLGCGPIDDLLGYSAIAGPLRVNGDPIALEVIRAEGRRFPAWDEPRVLGVVASALHLSIPELVEIALSRPERLDDLNRQLAAGCS